MTAALAAFLLSARRMGTRFGPQRSSRTRRLRPAAPLTRPGSFAQATRAPVQLTAPRPAERMGVNTTPTNLRSAQPTGI